jgi:hypothetical protein
MLTLANKCFPESTRGVSSWAILCAHLSAERLSFPTTTRVRARFSMDVTKRCSAEIKQAHKQFAGHMTKIIRKHVDGYTPLICVSPRYVDEA